ncbi:hypothetical protein BGZ60DRAFT_437138 [Tricladium varicosporioides]|nr:hypothetical protein BGZ60DRAFT_437138 [Hymenoscyphus varicosporioides]
MSNLAIHTGIWVDHDLHPMIGATLTTSIRMGNYLIAAISSLVAWASVSAWSILMFYLHQRYASRPDKDLLDQQLQVLFRSSATLRDTFTDAIRLQRAWAGHIGRTARHTFPVAIVAVVWFAAFAVAGVFVSEVASKSYQQVAVLAQPLDCGDFMPMGISEVGGSHYQAKVDYLMLSAKRAREYTSLIYNGSSDRYQSAFKNPILPSKGEYVDCPSPWTINTTCLGPNATQGLAYRMDTGQLDSHTHFGINAPKRDRITYRKSVTCGVLDPTSFSLPVETMTHLVHGSLVNQTYISLRVTGANQSSIAGDCDIAVPISTLYDLDAGYFTRRSVFKLYEEQNLPTSCTMTNPMFNRTDADVTLWIVTYGGLEYESPVDDPLFLAHNISSVTSHLEGVNWGTSYFPTNSFGFLACYDQFQICNPSNGRCSNLTGANDMYRAINSSLDFNKVQETTAKRLIGVAKVVGYYYMGSALGGFGLLAADYSGGVMGHSLPPDQWVTEIRAWFSTHLVVFQNQLLMWARKPWSTPGNPTVEYSLINMTRLNATYKESGLMNEFTDQCTNQLIRSSAAVQNFSILATGFVIFTCLLIIMTATLLPTCVRYSRARRMEKGKELSEKTEAARLALFADEKYHLLAMALRASGVDKWECGKGGIPITKKPVHAPRLAEEHGLSCYSTKNSKDVAETAVKTDDAAQDDLTLSNCLDETFA